MLIDEITAEVVADNRNCICCKFVCDEQWEDVSKVARFIYNGEYKDVVLDADCMCICPSEVVKKGRFSVGLYGADLKATTPLVVSVLDSILSDSGSELPDDPTPDVYTQVLQITADATQAADEATLACWEAVDTSNKAIEALNAAKLELEENGFVTTIKEKHKGTKLGFWVGTQEEYDLLPNKPANCFVIISDDNTMSELRLLYSTLSNNFEVLNKYVTELNEKISPKLDNSAPEFNKVLFETDTPITGESRGTWIPCPGIENYRIIAVDNVIVTREPLNPDTFTATYYGNGHQKTVDVLGDVIKYSSFGFLVYQFECGEVDFDEEGNSIYGLKYAYNGQYDFSEDEQNILKASNCYSLGMNNKGEAYWQASQISISKIVGIV